MALRIAFATLGCKVNRADTAALRDALPGEDFEVVDFTAPADVYVINTCTVTAVADRQSRQLVTRAHRRNPGARVIVTGCLAERAPEQVRDLPGVDLVVPNFDKPGIASRLRSRPATGTAPMRYDLHELTRPPLKIQDGCSGSCAYCAVAAVRGAPRSLAPDEVVARLGDLARAGCAEAVLAGIDLGAYGLDHAPPTRLAGLIRRLGAERPIHRVRLSSVEVHRLDAELIEALGQSAGVICRHLHLPLQSGADAVLRRMRRPYAFADYATAVRRAHAALPGLHVSADVIAGFPGETDDDHRETLDRIRTLGLAYLHVFPFSPRPGTPAATMPDPVPDRVVRDRARELRDLGAALWQARRTALVGQRLEAVVEGTRREGRLVAFADPGVAVRLDGPDAWMGQVIDVRVDGLDEDGVVGTRTEADPDGRVRRGAAHAEP